MFATPQLAHVLFDRGLFTYLGIKLQPECISWSGNTSRPTRSPLFHCTDHYPIQGHALVAQAKLGYHLTRTTWFNGRFAGLWMGDWRVTNKLCHVTHTRYTIDTQTQGPKPCVGKSIHECAAPGLLAAQAMCATNEYAVPYRIVGNDDTARSGDVQLLSLKGGGGRT